MCRELRALPPDVRAEALAQARATPMTSLESTAMVLSVGAVAVATRYLLGDTPRSRLEAFAYSFVLALALLTATVGFCHVARIKRGVKEWGARHHRP